MMVAVFFSILVYHIHIWWGVRELDSKRIEWKKTQKKKGGWWWKQRSKQLHHHYWYIQATLSSSTTIISLPHSTKETKNKKKTPNPAIIFRVFEPKFDASEEFFFRNTVKSRISFIILFKKYTGKSISDSFFYGWSNKNQTPIF